MPMYSLMFLAFALAQLGLFVWLLGIYRRSRNRGALALLFPQFFLIWDNLRVAVGVVIGFGDLLYALSWPAFWAHWLSGCWLIITCGAILRLANFEFAARKWVMGGFCLLTTALVLHDLPLFWTKDIYPVCEFDLIRYSGTVTEANRCSATQALVPSDGPPIAPIVTCFVTILVGALLWLRRGLPWLTLGGIAMLLTVAIPVLNRHRLDNLGEVFIHGGAILTLWQLTRLGDRQARSALPLQDQPAG